MDLPAELLALPQRTFWRGSSEFDLRYLAVSTLLFAALLGEGNVRRGLVRIWRALDLGRVLRTRSGQLDVLIFVLNATLLSSLLLAAQRAGPGMTGVGRSLASGVMFWTDQPVLGRFSGAVAKAVLLLLLADLWSYVLHRSMHRVPFLWAIHKVHHSATELYPMTVFRFHPVELMLIALPTIPLSSFATGFVGALGGPGVETLRFLGANVALALLFLFGAVYRHSRVWVTLPGPLRNVIHSPAHHQIHHSADPADFNANFSSNLLVWDRLFGTYRDPVGREQPARLGIDDKRAARAHANPVGVFVYPLYDAATSFKKRGV